jgi:protein-tyrosine phosphatase
MLHGSHCSLRAQWARRVSLLSHPLIPHRHPAGDFEAAQDLEFIVANKITRIINCAGREVANGWERSGIRYLTYYWPESGNCIIFDESNSVLDEIYSFIEEAIDVGESVLVHSTDGVSRACFCSAVYFMLKYRW